MIKIKRESRVKSQKETDSSEQGEDKRAESKVQNIIESSEQNHENKRVKSE